MTASEWVQNSVAAFRTSIDTAAQIIPALDAATVKPTPTHATIIAEAWNESQSRENGACGGDCPPGNEQLGPSLHDSLNVPIRHDL